MQKNCLKYPVAFIEDAFGESAELADLLKKATESEAPGVLLVADANVVQRTEGLGTKIGRYVQAYGIRLLGSPVVLPGGEKIKADGFQSAFRVMDAALEAKLGRHDCVLAIGGGSLLDVAGYAAAQVRGGVRLVRMPTTPAALIDAAFADYAALDGARVKDAWRVPSVPAAVVLDALFARTVLDGVWRGGFGEAVRLAAVSDGPFLKRLVKGADAYRNRDFDTLADIVKTAAAVRAKKGPTSFAAWLACRLEALSDYKLPHGYAVAIAVCLETNYAVAKGVLAAKDRDLVVGALQACGALDGLAHSRHVLAKVHEILLGLETWQLTAAEAGIVLPSGLGKQTVDEVPDRETYGQVLRDFVAADVQTAEER